MAFLSISLLVGVLFCSLLFIMLNQQKILSVLVKSLRCYLPPGREDLNSAITQLNNKVKKNAEAPVSIRLVSFLLDEDSVKIDSYFTLCNIFFSVVGGFGVSIALEYILWKVFCKPDFGAMYLGLFSFSFLCMGSLLFQYKSKQMYFRSFLMVGFFAFCLCFIFVTIGVESFLAIELDHSLWQFQVRLLSNHTRHFGENFSLFFFLFLSFVCAVTSCSVFSSCKMLADGFSKLDSESEEADSQSSAEQWRRFMVRLDFILPAVLVFSFSRSLQDDISQAFSNLQLDFCLLILLFAYIVIHFWIFRRYCQGYLNLGVSFVQDALAEKSLEKIQSLPLLLGYLRENLFLYLYKYFIPSLLLLCVFFLRIGTISLMDNISMPEEDSFLFKTVPVVFLHNFFKFVEWWLLFSQFLFSYGSLIWSQLDAFVFKK